MFNANASIPLTKVGDPFNIPIFGEIACKPSEQQSCSNFMQIGELLEVPLPELLCDENVQFLNLSYRAGQRIYTLGQDFKSLYCVTCGFLKSVSYDEFGHEQVLNFSMKGDLLGTDSIYSTHHNSEAICLSDCCVIILPYKKLIELSQIYPQVAEALIKKMSHALACQQARLAMLGKMSCEARVAQFLLLLSDRFATLGYSKNQFVLRMTRCEIGSYLGLSLETVSRVFSSLDDLGIISVHQKKISINNSDALKQVFALTK